MYLFCFKCIVQICKDPVDHKLLTIQCPVCNAKWLWCMSCRSKVVRSCYSVTEQNLSYAVNSTLTSLLLKFTILFCVAQIFHSWDGDTWTRGVTRTGKPCSGMCSTSKSMTHLVFADIQWFKPTTEREVMAILDANKGKKIMFLLGNTVHGIYDDQSPDNFDIILDLTGFREIYSVSRATWAGNLVAKHIHPEFPSDVLVLLQVLKAKVWTACGEPPMVMNCLAMFALKGVVEAARRDIGQNVFFPLNAPATVEACQLACLTDPSEFVLL